AGFAGPSGGAARRHPGLLRPRVHVGQRRLRADAGAGQPRARRADRSRPHAARTQCAHPAGDARRRTGRQSLPARGGDPRRSHAMAKRDGPFAKSRGSLRGAEARQGPLPRMSTPRATICIRLAMTLAISMVLAACATQPPKPSPTPAVVTAIPVVPLPQVAPADIPEQADEPWASIIASDVMPDCADSPLIRANAAMYTRSPARFEQLLQQSLPLIIYVHKQLQDAGIPGEFAMLPMLESSYNAAEPGHRNNPAGMWQLMPRTARLHGVTVNRQYDGRLDPVASTRAAIKMLKALNQRFEDWRLTDMAYNSGPYAVLGALREHPELGSEAIPAIPVSRTTRTHLARLMALSCILRQPERFQVQLPKPSSADGLATIEVPAGTRLKNAAEMAEISDTKLRALNPGYVGGSVPSDSPRTLLLPAGAVESLATALN